MITAVTVEKTEAGNWLVTVERGNADSVETLTLTDLERRQLASMLDTGAIMTARFQDVTA